MKERSPALDRALWQIADSAICKFLFPNKFAHAEGRELLSALQIIRGAYPWCPDPTLINQSLPDYNGRRLTECLLVKHWKERERLFLAAQKQEKAGKRI